MGEVGVVGPGTEGEGATVPPQRLAPFPGNCCSFLSLNTTWPSPPVKQDQHLRVRALQRALPTKSTGATLRMDGGGGGGAGTQPADTTAAAAAAIRPTPAAALRRGPLSSDDLG